MTDVIGDGYRIKPDKVKAPAGKADRAALFSFSASGGAGKVSPAMAEQRTALIEEFLKKDFKQLCLIVKNGARVKEAIAEMKVHPRLLDATIRQNAKAAAAWDEAKLAQVWCGWDYETVEQVLEDVALGKYVTDALADRGLPEYAFRTLALKDPLIKRMYDDACEIRTERWAEKLERLGESKDDDILPNGRPNTANVQRDVLNSNNLKWMMGKFARDRFGDKVVQDGNINLNVSVVERLEKARKRVEEAKRVTKQVKDT